MDFYASGGRTAVEGLKPGSISGLTFRNIRATSHSRMASSVTTAEGCAVEDVTLENVLFDGVGGGTREEALSVLPEYAGGYPENRMYGFAYPASGLFVRRVRNLCLDGVSLTTRREDFRPAVVLEEAEGVRVRSLTTTPPAGGIGAVVMRACRDVEGL